MSDSDEWIDVLAADALPNNEVVGVNASGWELALYCVDGALYASDGICSHGQARLCDGFLEGHEIECPLHQGRFDVRSGKPLCAPVTEALRSYPVRLVNGRVLVKLF